MLLIIFDLYRSPEPDENGYANPISSHLWFQRQRWWYKLVHVCRLWRCLILASPSRLDLNLFYTHGVPVEDMLEHWHSPPLPLIIYFSDRDRDVTEKTEAGILLALSPRYRDRVHHIYIFMPNAVFGPRKLIKVMDGHFPILKSMYFHSDAKEVFPATFNAPNLRCLSLATASLPNQSPLLTTAAGLVTLEFYEIPEAAYFPPSYLLTQLPLIPQLERLSIGFDRPLNIDVERQQLHTEITLPNLRWFSFLGTSAYLEGLVGRISAPSLRNLHVYLFHQFPFTFPRLLRFMKSSENIRFNAAEINFDIFGVTVSLEVDPSEVWFKHPPVDPALDLVIICREFDLQIASAAQILDMLSPVLSVVERVTLSQGENGHRQLSDAEWHDHVNRTQWRNILRHFNNATALRVQDEFVGMISHSLLQSEDEELRLELLPNLQQVGYSGEGHCLDPFIAFVNERQLAGHPVNLILLDRSSLDDSED